MRSLPGQYETGSAVLGAIESMQLYGRPDDYVSTLKSRIEAQDDDAIRAAAREVIDLVGLGRVSIRIGLFDRGAQRAFVRRAGGDGATAIARACIWQVVQAVHGESGRRGRKCRHQQQCCQQAQPCVLALLRVQVGAEGMGRHHGGFRSWVGGWCGSRRESPVLTHSEFPLPDCHLDLFRLALERP